MTPTPSCCGREMRRVEIQTRPSRLTLLACSRCDTSTWLTDGTPTSRDLVLDAMRTVGRAAPARALVRP